MADTDAITADALECRCKSLNDVAGEWVYHVGDILREFLGHNFVSGLRALKSNYNKLKKLKT